MEVAEHARWSAPATPESVQGLRQAVVEFAQGNGVPDPPLADVRLAVSEAVSNAVRHGYGHATSAGSVQVSAQRSRRELRIVVTDSGVGLAARTPDPGAGLGLLLIGEVTDGLEIREHRPSGTEVHMSFNLP